MKMARKKKLPKPEFIEDLQKKYPGKTISGKPFPIHAKGQAKPNEASGSFKARHHDNVYVITVTRARRYHGPKEMTLNEVANALKAVVVDKVECEFGSGKNSATVRFYTDDKMSDGISDS